MGSPYIYRLLINTTVPFFPRNHLKREKKVQSRDFAVDTDLQSRDNPFNPEHSLIREQGRFQPPWFIMGD